MPAWALILLVIGALACTLLCVPGNRRLPGRKAEKYTPATEQGTLLFGQEEDIFSAREWLKKSHFCYDEVDAPSLPRKGYFYLFLALSKSDVDNLVLCAAAKRQYEGIKTAARLSDTVYLPVYKQTGVDYILPAQGDAEIMELLKYVHPRA